MAASGFTPILIYASGTASNVPLAANLTSSASGAELALNYADGKLYFKNSSGVVTLLAGAGGAGVVAGSNTQIQFNNSGVFGASANLTWDGSKVTASAYQTGGNLTFTGTGNRITGDFSNATASNRVIFQTSTASSNTRIGMMPSSASTGTAGPVLYSTNDPNNASVFDIRITDGVGASLQSTFNGTGSNLPMTFHTGGSERMRLDTSGNLGIGTSSPGAKLDVQVSGNEVLKLTATTGTNSIYQTINNTGGAFTIGRENSAGTSFGVSAYASVLFSAGAYPMVFATQNIERMRIDSSGNVGIGTASPAGKLEVSGGRSWFTANSELYSIAFRYSSSTGVMYMGATNSVSTPSIQFSNSGGTALATIDYSGNVGIGTTSPDVKLQTNGIIKSGATGTNGEIQLARTSDGLGVGKVTMTEATQVMNYNNLLGSGIHSFTINATERMRIDSSGNVGIGTSSPTQKLDVNGIGRMRFSSGTGAGHYLDTTGNTSRFFVGTDAVTEAWRVYDAIGGTNRIYLDSSGNVGIGTSSSAARLSVVNDQAALSYLFDTSNVTNGGSSLWRMITRNIANTGTTSVDFYKPSGTGFSIINNDTNASNFTAFNVGSAERMRINSSGQVGIGTSAPTGQLDVRTAAGVVAQSNLYTGSSAAVVKFNIGQVGTIDWDIGLTATNGHFYIGGLGGSMAEAYKIVRTGTNIDYQTWNTNSAERMRIDSSGNVLVTSAAGLGYGTGSGGTVTQATSKSTGVTLNKPTGQITMNAAALGAGASVIFLLTNSLLAATDSVIVQPNYGANSQSYAAQVTFSGAGGAYIRVTNISGGSLSEAVTLSFAIIKGATA